MEKPFSRLLKASEDLRWRYTADDPDYKAYEKAERDRDWQKAIEALERILKRKPDSGQAYADLAFVFVQLDRFDEALPIIKKAIDLGVTDSMAWATLGDTCMALRKFSEAEAAFKQELKSESDEALTAHAWENLYRLYDHLGRSEEAAEALQRWKRALSATPKSIKKGF